MTLETLHETLLSGEHLKLECKLAKDSLPKSMWESYSAFANTVGGKILLGIEEHPSETNPARRFTVNGVDNPRKLVEDLWNTINSNKVSSNILIHNDVEIIDVDGKFVISINVPQASWRVRPVYLNDNMMRGSYKRNNEGDYHCTEGEVRAMIRDASEDGNDGALMEHYTMDDVDPDTLRRYRTMFKHENQLHPWNDVDDKTFLINMQAYAIDRATGQEALTAAGLMMFGKGLSIRERFANFRMEYLDMSNTQPGESYRDRLTYDGRWENNLYQFFTLVGPKLTFDLPRPFKLKDGMQRIDDTMQIAAVREAFTNAIIHCDMFGSAGILRIDKYDDRLVLRNPGTLLIPIEKLYAGGSSKARNPRIQNMLRMIGYGENIGSGFAKILHAWELAGWDKPYIVNDLANNEVIITMPVEDELKGTPKTAQKNSEGNPSSTGEYQQDIPQEPHNKTEQKGTPKGTPKTEQKSTPKGTPKTNSVILELIRQNPTITRLELSEITQKSVFTIRKHINNLKSAGRIKRVGPNNGGHWQVIEKD